MIIAADKNVIQESQVGRNLLWWTANTKQETTIKNVQTQLDNLTRKVEVLMQVS